MPLASIIDKLTSFVSKYIVISSFIPVLMFAFISGAILYHDFVWFREWAKSQLSGTGNLYHAGALFIGLAILAYLVSTVNTFLREILEGKHLLECCSWLRRMFQVRQQQKLAEIQKKYKEARDGRNAIVKQKYLVPEENSWAGQLQKAAAIGRKANYGKGLLDLTKLKFTQLQSLQSQGELLALEDIEAAVLELIEELKSHDESVPVQADKPDSPKPLMEARIDMLNLIDYAEDTLSSEELREFNELQSLFGVSFVAPTAMGNVALSMQGYAMTRYQLNLEKFWGDLQVVILQTNKDFYAQLQDAKAQLDFLVTSCWLSVLVTIICGFILVTQGHSSPLFLAVSLGGPAAAYFFYLLGVKNYQSFAELVKIAVDLYRFQLLDRLHVARPKTARDERVTWDTLQRLSYPGSEGTELSYKPDTNIGTQ